MANDEILVSAVDNVSGPLEQIARALQRTSATSQAAGRELTAAFNAMSGGNLSQVAAGLERLIGLFGTMEQRTNAAANAQARLAAEGKRATPFTESVAHIERQVLRSATGIVDTLVKHNQLGGMNEADVRRVVADQLMRGNRSYAATKQATLQTQLSGRPDVTQRLGTTGDLARLPAPANLPAESPFAKNFQSELNVQLTRQVTAARRGSAAIEHGAAADEAAARASDESAAAKRRRTIGDKRAAELTEQQVAAARPAGTPLTATGGSGGGQRPPAARLAVPEPPEPPRGPQVTATTANHTPAWSRAQYEEAISRFVALRRESAVPTKGLMLAPLGGGYAYDANKTTPGTEDFYHRDLGKLDLTKHGEQFLNALDRYAKGVDKATLELNQRTYRAGVGNQTGDWVHRDLGVLDPNNETHRPYVQVADREEDRQYTRVAQQANADSLARRKAIADAENATRTMLLGQVGEVYKQEAAEHSARIGRDRQREQQQEQQQRARQDRLSAQELNDQQLEYLRQQGRVNAKDPLIRRTNGGFLDTSGDQPTFQRIVGKDRAVPGSVGDLATALASERDAQASQIRADNAERRLNEARERFAHLQERMLHEASVPAEQRTLHQAGGRIYDTSDPNNTRVFRASERQATAEELQGAERNAALKTRELTATRSQLVANEHALAVSERELNTMIAEQNKRGILNNFLTGVSNSGFGGGPSFSGRFDGLARSAGQAVKYNALYSIMGVLQTAVAGAAQEFLNMDDSITELEVVMGEAAATSADFSNALQDVASLGGFNVGEAMDVAARGVRAFRTELETANEAMVASGNSSETLDQAQQRFGENFAKEASRLAVLSTTTLSDAAGNLTAIAKGYQLPSQGAGLRQVTDAVAGAKLAGGGDETQIFQGLANSAVLFKEMGFSLREAATIISSLNAETDQSGQLLATRVSRLAQILQGESGKKFLTEINQSRPTGTAPVDTTADAKTQMVQLSEIYQKMGASQRQVLSSRLGGSSQAREILILLDKLSGDKGILAKAGDDKMFDNAGLREFERRLTNVRAQLTVILGNVRGVVTNLAASGLADPFVTLVRVVKDLTTLLKEASQVVLSLASAFRPFTSIASNLLALGASLKVISSIRNAGGVGNALLALEGRVAPTRTLARMQLGAPTPESQLLQGGLVDSYYLRSVAKSETAAKILTGTAGDAKVAEAAKKLRASANDLQRAEEELRAIPFGTLARPVAIQRVSDARATAALDQADLDRQQRIQAQAARANAGIDTRRDDATDRFAKDAGRVVAERDLITRQMGTLEKAGQEGTATYARLERHNAVLMEREAEIRRAFNVTLAKLDAERAVAERGAVRAAEMGNLGFLGGSRAKIAEAGGGVGGAVRAAGASLKAGAASLGSGALALAGGAPGVAIIAGIAAVSAAGAAKSAFDDVSKAQQEAAKVASLPLKASAESLRAAAEANKAAADNLAESTSGFWGRIADHFSSPASIDPTTGQKTEAGTPPSWLKTLGEIWGGAIETFTLSPGAASEQARQQTQLAKFEKQSADRLDALKAEAATAPTATGLSAALDFSGVDALTASIRTLSDSGRSAAEIVGAVSSAIDTLGGGNLNTNQLNTRDIGATKRVIFAAGMTEFTTLQSEQQGIVDSYMPGGKNYKRDQLVNPGLAAAGNLGWLENSGAGWFGGEAAKAAGKVLSEPNIDINSQTAQEKFKEVLDSNLRADSIPPDMAKRYAELMVPRFTEAAGKLEETLNDPEKLKSLALGGLGQVGQLAGADAATAARTKQLATGGAVNVSAQEGADARLATFQGLYGRLKAKIESRVASKDLSVDEGDTMLAALDRQLADARLNALEQRANTAKALIADNDRLRQAQQRGASTAAQVTAIGQAFFEKDLKAAVDSHDVDLIIDVLNKASAGQIAVARRALEKNLKVAQAEADNSAKVVSAGAAAEIAAAKANLDNVERVNPDSRQANAARERYERAKTAAQHKPSAKATADLEAAKAALNAFNSAAARANPQDIYGSATDSLGGINARDRELSRQAANATSSRDELTASRIERDKAQVRLAAEAAKSGGKNTEAYAQALKAYYEAVNSFNDKVTEIAALHRQAGIDLSDPVATAAEETRNARDKLARDKAKGMSQSVLDRDTVELHQKQNAEEASLHQRRLTDAQNAQQLGRLSQAEYMRALEAERSRIQTLLKGTKQGTNMYQQLKDELIDSELKIKQAANEMSGQFNLGDIKVPTVYEVRRAIANAQASTSTVNQAVIANTTNNAITFNGADNAQVEAILRKLLGATPRYTPAARKG